MLEIFICYNDNDFEHIQRYFMKKGYHWSSLTGLVHDKPIDIRSFKNRKLGTKKIDFSFPIYIRKIPGKNISWGIYEKNDFFGYKKNDALKFIRKQKLKNVYVEN